MTASDTTSTTLSGIGVSPGLVAGPVARMAPPIPEPEIATLEPSRDVEKECERIALAAQQVKKGLELSAAEAKAEARAHGRVREDDRDGEDADIHTEEGCDQVSAAVPREVQAEHEGGHGNQVNGDQNQGGHWCLLLSMHQFPHATL